MADSERKLIVDKFNRGLDDVFFNDLKNGLLNPLLELVKADNTLMLAIRDGYINIYYRGGSLLTLTKLTKGTSQYKAEFRWNYAKTKNESPKAQELVFSQDEITELERRISENNILETQEQVKQWLADFPRLKQIMDIHLIKAKKAEREFQQLVVRENNFSKLANQTDYFIVSIEATANIDKRKARYDLLAAKWPATQTDRRKDQVSLAFIEMKYAEKALEGKASLIKHIKDVEELIKTPGQLSVLHENLTKQFNQLNELGLLEHEQRNREFEFKKCTKPEVILLLASYPPQSQLLSNLFNKEKDLLGCYANHELFDLKFHWPHSAGYGLFRNDMISLEEFKRNLKF